ASDLQHLGRGPVPNISSTSSERRRLWALACAGLTMLRVPAQSSGLGGLGVTKLQFSPPKPLKSPAQADSFGRPAKVIRRLGRLAAKLQESAPASAFARS